MAGCNGYLRNLYTTPESREQANHLVGRVTAYADEQRERIETLNEDYRLTYGRLSDELARLGTRELRQATALDALHQTDALVKDLAGESLPGRFRDELEARIVAQRAKIAEVDASIAAARKAYADSYQEVSLELARLTKVEKKLDALSTSADEQDAARDLIQTVFKAYQVVKKREDEERKKAATSQPADQPAAPS
jgi:hypothetical protein